MFCYLINMFFPSPNNSQLPERKEEMRTIEMYTWLNKWFMNQQIKYLHYL